VAHRSVDLLIWLGSSFSPLGSTDPCWTPSCATQSPSLLAGCGLGHVLHPVHDSGEEQQNHSNTARKSSLATLSFVSDVRENILHVRVSVAGFQHGAAHRHAELSLQFETMSSYTTAALLLLSNNIGVEPVGSSEQRCRPVQPLRQCAPTCQLPPLKFCRHQLTAEAPGAQDLLLLPLRRTAMPGGRRRPLDARGCSRRRTRGAAGGCACPASSTRRRSSRTITS
jgi:hypothetical protein